MSTCGTWATLAGPRRARARTADPRACPPEDGTLDMRTFRALLLACLTGSFLAATAPAQCVPIGPGCAVSGMNLFCGTPQIGTNWSIAEQNATACGGSSSNPVPILTVFGSCLVPGFVVMPPLACAACGGCDLNVLPIDFVLQWTWPPRSTSVPIPMSPRLVGVQFCIQNACVDPTSLCICLSGAAQATITP